MQSSLTAKPDVARKAAPEIAKSAPKELLPACQDLVISTKTECLYLNTQIVVPDIFWKIPVIRYWEHREGVIKKQTKIICSSNAEYEDYKARLALLQKNEYNEKVIKFVDNTGFVPLPSALEPLEPLAQQPVLEPADKLADKLAERPLPQLSKTAANRRRLKYKNERKLTVGISKKDILNVRRKEKLGAFYNCVALTIRICCDGTFYECHAKIFNTGKIEVPGRIDKPMMEQLKHKILAILQPFHPDIVMDYKMCKRGVLINSGFNCGFLIDRDKIHSILKTKYGIETSYDSCSYQGVKCKFYYNESASTSACEQKGRILEADLMKKKDLIVTTKYTEVAFMIFRTGSCIIVGNCCKKVLYFVYDFIKTVFKNEYREISMGPVGPPVTKNKKKRRITVTCSPEYYRDCVTTAFAAAPLS